MVMTGLRAVAIAVVGFVFAGPAYANGQVENAMQLWLGDLRTAYDKSVDLIEDRKINDAKGAVEELQELTYQMTTATDQIEENAKSLAPELGAAWADTKVAMLQLHQAASALKQQLGRQKPDVELLKTAFLTADGAVLKSWEFTKGFGKRYGALMGGPVENAKQLFDGAVSDSYESTVEYLDAYNTDRGKTEIDILKELTGRLYELTETASRSAGEIARPLSDAWAPASTALKDFQIAVGLIQGQVGNEDFDLGDMKSGYADLNAALVTSYKGVMTFGEKLRAICDDWD